MKDVAEDLLAAHVEYELSRLRGPALDALLEEWLAAAFQWLADIKFNDVVTRAQIVGVIERYVIELKVSGGIAELAGEMANVVFSSESSARTRVADVCPPTQYEDFADKIVTLEGVQRDLIHYVTQSPAFRTLASRFLSLTLTDLLFGGDGEGTSRAGRRMTSFVGSPVLRRLERRVAAALGRYLEKHPHPLT
jgi:hypothetical protein